MDGRQEIKSLKKALRALTFLNAHGDSTVTEVAKAIGVPRTTSYRLLETLASEGYVEKQSHSDVYRLTSLVQRLSSGFGDTDLVVEIAKPLVHRTGLELGWPLALATPSGNDMVVRVSTDHDTSLAIDRFRIGFATPILFAPSGLCYLAHCHAAERERILISRKCDDEVFKAQFQRTEYIEHLLEQIRVRGYCHIAFAEFREGGLAVPLLIGDRCVGGIVMRFMKSNVKLRDLEVNYFPVLQRLAETIVDRYTAVISGQPSDPSSSGARFTPPGAWMKSVAMDARAGSGV